MAQRPTFPSPYLNAIDATVDNDFICLINDRDVITSYVFTIVDAATSSSVYNLNKSVTVYGGMGNDSYLIISVPADTLSNDVNYKWKVTLTDSGGSTVESKEYYFSCIKEPELSITSNNIVDGVINSANAAFLGNYICKSPLVFYRFILERDGEVIGDTGEVYSQYLHYEYDMFIQGSYSLTLQTENEGRMKSETKINFSVDYTTAVTNIAPNCYVSQNENSVVLDLSNIVSIPGIYTSEEAQYQSINVTDTLKGVYIPKDTELYWEERVGISKSLEIDEKQFSIGVMVNLPYGKQGEIIRISGDNEIIVSFDGYKINYNYSNGISGSINICKESEYSFANIPATENIDNNKLYNFSFNDTDIYNFSSDYQFVFQNPMNMFWWLIIITPDGVTATKGVEVNV